MEASSACCYRCQNNWHIDCGPFNDCGLFNESRRSVQAFKGEEFPACKYCVCLCLFQIWWWHVRSAFPWPCGPLPVAAEGHPHISHCSTWMYSSGTSFTATHVTHHLPPPPLTRFCFCWSPVYMPALHIAILTSFYGFVRSSTFSQLWGG